MYLALYRKYRPKTFGDVLSQDHITSTLKNEIKLKKVAHAYIFTGPRGTGKTSCAKIFSKAINCENPIDGEPCCKCKMCVAIENESVLDVTEMDGASNNSVSTIRNLRDEAGFVPAVCKYRIYIIDEAHMLSSSAFNALLKIMEEPPKYVIFILATTEIYKLPKTVVSRCQRFDFVRIKIKDIEKRLSKVCVEEGIDISFEASKKIAALSSGSMRDALSILDKCIIGRNTLDIETVEHILNIAPEGYIFNLHKSIKDRNICDAICIINDLYDSGKNLEHLIFELLEFYHEMIYYNIFGEKACEVIEYNKYLSEFKNISSFCKEELIFIEEELLGCCEKIRNSSNSKLQIELSLLNICRVKRPSSITNSKQANTESNINDEESSKDIGFILDEIRRNDKNVNKFLDESKIYIENKKLIIELSKLYSKEDILKYKNIIIDSIKGKIKKDYEVVLKSPKIISSKEDNISGINRFLGILKKNDIDIEIN